MSLRFDCIVIGVGAMGSSTVYNLSKRGKKVLGLERFDVLYIHDAMGVPIDEVMGADGALGALRQLQKEGIVKWVGTAAHDPATNAQYL